MISNRSIFLAVIIIVFFSSSIFAQSTYAEWLFTGQSNINSDDPQTATTELSGLGSSNLDHAAYNPSTADIQYVTADNLYTVDGFKTINITWNVWRFTITADGGNTLDFSELRVYHNNNTAPSSNGDLLDRISLRTSSGTLGTLAGTWNASGYYTFDLTPLATTTSETFDICPWSSEGGTYSTRLQASQIVLTGGTPLPVELTSFTAESVGDDVELKWSTASEVNNYGFEVERKQAAGEWLNRGFVQGHGNSNSPKHYEFIDVDVPEGDLEYRLKQIDTDGSYEYYNLTAQVNNGGITSAYNYSSLIKDYSLEQNFPNPFNPVTTISYSLPEQTNVRLKVYDISGSDIVTIVDETKAAGRYLINFDARNLSSGIYFYSLTTDKFKSVKKLIVMK